MALTQVEKVKIKGVITKYSLDNIYYEDFEFPKRKDSDSDLVDYIADLAIKAMTQESKTKDAILTKCFASILIIIDHCIYYKKQLSASSLEKAFTLKTYYFDYLDKFSLEEDDLIITYLTNICGRILEEIPEKKLEAVDQIEKESSKGEISRTTNQEITELKETIEKKDKAIRDLKADKKSLTTKVSTLEKEKKEKDKTIVGLQNEITTLQAENAQNFTTIEGLSSELSSKKEENIGLNRTIATMKKDLTCAEKKSLEKDKIILNYTKQQEKKIKLKQVEQEIFKMLCYEQLTLNQILEKINQNGFELTKDEIREILYNIKTYANITPLIGSIPRSYHAERVEYSNVEYLSIGNKKFTFELSKEREIDFLLFADTHLDIRRSEVFDCLDAIYNYCNNNSIKNIICLGDLFDCKTVFDINNPDGFYKTVDFYKRNIDEFLRRYPYQEGITNAFLGGNHDQYMLSASYNPMEILQMERDDFVSLGYNDATINIGKDKIMVHHPSHSTTLTIKKAVNSYLMNYYKKYGLDRDTVYIDLFGHYHVNSISEPNGYALITTLTDRYDSLNGACHMKVVLDKDDNISMIIFMPLLLRKKLVQVSEVEYKKILK